MIKKLGLIFSAVLTFCACQTLQENYNMVNCKYELLAVEFKDMDFTNLDLDVVLGITNVNKKTAAAIQKFDGDLYINDVDVTKIALRDISVDPDQAKPVRVPVQIPIANMAKNLSGLIAMGSNSLTYYVKGTMYFTTPLGEIPYPVTIYQSKK